MKLLKCSYGQQENISSLWLWISLDTIDSNRILLSPIEDPFRELYAIDFHSPVVVFDVIWNDQLLEIIIIVGLDNYTVHSVSIPVNTILSIPIYDIKSIPTVDPLSFLSTMQSLKLNDSSTSQVFHTSILLTTFMNDITFIKAIDNRSILVSINSKQDFTICLIVLPSPSLPPQIIKRIPLRTYHQSEIGNITTISIFYYKGQNISIEEDCLIKRLCKHQTLWQRSQTILFLGTSCGYVLWFVVPAIDNISYDLIEDIELYCRCISIYPSAIQNIILLSSPSTSINSRSFSHICIFDITGNVYCIGVKHNPYDGAYYSDDIICENFPTYSHITSYKDCIVYLNNQNIYAAILSNPSNSNVNTIDTKSKHMDSDNESKILCNLAILNSIIPIQFFDILSNDIILHTKKGEFSVLPILSNITDNLSITSTLDQIRQTTGYITNQHSSDNSNSNNTNNNSNKKNSSQSGILHRIESISQQIKELIISEDILRNRLDKLNVDILQLSILTTVIASNSLNSPNTSDNIHFYPLSIPKLNWKIYLSSNAMSETILAIDISTKNHEVVRCLQGMSLCVHVLIQGHKIIIPKQSMTFSILFQQLEHNIENGINSILLDEDNLVYQCHLRGPMEIASVLDNLQIDCYLVLSNLYPRIEDSNLVIEDTMDNNSDSNDINHSSLHIYSHKIASRDIVQNTKDNHNLLGNNISYRHIQDYSRFLTETTILSTNSGSNSNDNNNGNSNINDTILSLKITIPRQVSSTLDNNSNIDSNNNDGNSSSSSSSSGSGSITNNTESYDAVIKEIDSFLTQYQRMYPMTSNHISSYTAIPEITNIIEPKFLQTSSNVRNYGNDPDYYRRMSYRKTQYDTTMSMAMQQSLPLVSYTLQSRSAHILTALHKQISVIIKERYDQIHRYEANGNIDNNNINVQTKTKDVTYKQDDINYLPKSIQKVFEDIIRLSRKLELSKISINPTIENVMPNVSIPNNIFTNIDNADPMEGKEFLHDITNIRNTVKKIWDIYTLLREFDT